MEIRLAFVTVLLLSVLLVFVPVVARLMMRRQLTPVLVALFVASRLLGWFGSYVLVAGLVQNSDLMLYYVDEANLAYNGAVPYLDYPSSYGPLFPYIAGLFLPFWDSPAAIALAIVLVEIAAVSWFTIDRTRDSEADPYPTNLFLFVYTVHPAALYWSGMMAYNSTFTLVFWVGAILFLSRSRYFASLMILGFSLLASKVLSILVAPLALAHPDRRITSIAFAGLFFLGLLVISGLFGVDLLTPLKIEGGRSTSGNLWFLLGGWLPSGAEGDFWRFAPPVVMLASICVFAYLCFRAWHKRPDMLQLCAAVSAVGWIFILLSKKTFPHYVPMFLLFTVYVFCVAFGRRLAWIAVVMVLGGIGILEPGVWNSLGQPVFLGAVPYSPQSMLLLALDLVLIATYSFCLVHSARLALRSPAHQT